MKIINPKEVLFEPEKFLGKKSYSLKELTKYVLVISLIPAIVFAVAIGILTSMTSYLQSIPAVSLMSLGDFGAYTGVTLTVIVFVFILIGAILSFLVGGGILHVFARLFGGKKEYADTLNAVAASMTPSLLLGWIPIVNIWTVIQSIVVMIMGVSKKQSISIFKSALTVAVPIAILSAIIPLIMLAAGGIAQEYTLVMQLIPISLVG